MRSISDSVWPGETNQASYGDGGMSTPRPARGRSRDPCRSRTPAKPTGSSTEQTVRSEPTRATRPVFANSLLERVAQRLQARVGRVVQQAQRRLTGRHHQRVPREGARLVHGSGRGDQVHQIAATSVGADRKAATDDLSQHREIGSDAVALLGAARRDPEAGDHLVEDEQRAALGAEPAESPPGTPAPEAPRRRSLRPAPR